MDKINEIWSNWHTEELIGSGTFGTVYKVKKEVLGVVSYAAVKVIQIPGNVAEARDLLASGMNKDQVKGYYEDIIQSLMEEIKIMESLKSSNHIVSIEDFDVREKEDELGWEVYIRMELLSALSGEVAKRDMTPTDVVRLAKDMCDALENCDRVNIIHRDIKLDNIFVNEIGIYKLGDFGISKQLEKTTSALSQKGTGAYMAPEVFRGEKYNKTVDVYSLGILMYRLLNRGRFPFEPPAPQPLYANEREAALYKRMSGETLPKIEGISEKLMNIVWKACEFQPDQRYSSATEMLEDLEHIDMANDTVVSSNEKEEASPVVDESVDEATGIMDETTGIMNRGGEIVDEPTVSMFGPPQDEDIDNEPMTEKLLRMEEEVEPESEAEKKRREQEKPQELLQELEEKFAANPMPEKKSVKVMRILSGILMLAVVVRWWVSSGSYIFSRAVLDIGDLHIMVIHSILIALAIFVLFNRDSVIVGSLLIFLGLIYVSMIMNECGDWRELFPMLFYIWLGIEAILQRKNKKLLVLVGMVLLVGSSAVSSLFDNLVYTVVYFLANIFLTYWIINKNPKDPKTVNH